jgi:hypothetical protein
MDKRSPTVRVLIISFLITYFLIAILLTGEVVLPTAILFLVLVLWFSVYKLRCRGLGTGELVAKMYADLERALEGAKERIAQEEAQRRSAEERKEQALREREKRKHSRDSRPTRDPATDRYVGIIETRVREGERTRRDPEGL